MDIIPIVERRAPNTSTVPPDLAKLPIRVPREKAAELVTQFFFKVSPRTMERWPLTWRRLNGRAHCETVQLFALAQSMINAAPPIASGRSKVTKQ